MSLSLPLIVRNIKNKSTPLTKFKLNVTNRFLPLRLSFKLKLYKPKSIHTTNYKLDGDLNKPFLENPFENDLFGYHLAVSQAMLDLTERCEAIEELVDIDEFDVTEKDGVFTMKLGPKGTYVINKQTPTRQLWFSSPVSGPKRYNYDIKTKKWRDSKDGSDMYEQLTKEIQSLLGIEWSMYK